MKPTRRVTTTKPKLVNVKIKTLLGRGKTVVPGLEKLHKFCHNKAHAFDLNKTWDQVFKESFNIDLDPTRYSIRKAKHDLQVVLHNLREEIGNLIGEYKTKGQELYSVAIVENNIRSKTKPPLAPVTNPKEQTLKNASSVSHNDSPIASTSKSYSTLERPVVAYMQKHNPVSIKRLATATPEEGHPNKRRKFEEDDFQSNFELPGFVSIQKDDDACTVYSQSSQDDCEENGIHYDTEFKDTIGKNLENKFTIGQLLKCHNSMEELKASSNLMKFSTQEPLLVAFLRELFEV